VFIRGWVGSDNQVGVTILPKIILSTQEKPEKDVKAEKHQNEPKRQLKIFIYRKGGPRQLKQKTKIKKKKLGVCPTKPRVAKGFTELQPGGYGGRGCLTGMKKSAHQLNKCHSFKIRKEQ